LLGILDKGILRLGDNTTVNFEKSLIFFTSNLGAREMMKEINPEIGFQTASRPRDNLNTRLESIALGAVRKKFSPEFVNRIDAVVTYQPLDPRSLETILDYDISRLQDHVNSRLRDNCFGIEVSPEARQFLLSRGFSEEYGARELKRTIHRELTQPLATMVARGEIPPGAQAHVALHEDGQSLAISSRSRSTVTPARPTILIADDNHDLLLFLAAQLADEGWEMLSAENAQQARQLFNDAKPCAVLLDYMLGADDGLKLGLEFQAQAPATQIVLMTGGGLTDDEFALCREKNVPILFKPFVAGEVQNLIRSRLARSFSAGSGGMSGP
jgi:CheY-like chemotaxis protein